MGFLLVLFPEDTTIASITKSLSFKRKNSSNNAILSKAQSTFSICFLLLFLTLLLFSLSTFQPSHGNVTPRDDVVSPSPALHRMGTLHRRGTRAMTDLIVCHVAENTNHPELRMFLRTLHRSGLTSKSDVVFIFSSHSTTFARVLHQENHSFLSLLTYYAELNSTGWLRSPGPTHFDATRFFKPPNKGEPLWGRRIRANYSEAELDRASYGSVLSFEANELDPENSLAGFLDRVPLSLRRWACYPMLLGRVRRNFKHVMLVDVKSLLLLNDPWTRVTNRSPDSVYVYPVFAKHGKNSDRSTHLVNSAILMGGARGMRRVAQAMLVAIVRASEQQRKKKNSVAESAILSQLVRNEFLLKNVDLVFWSESVPEPSSLAESKSFSNWSIIQRGTSNYDVNYFVKNQICSSVIDSFVYFDCKQLKKEELKQ